MTTERQKDAGQAQQWRAYWQRLIATATISAVVMAHATAETAVLGMS